MRKLAILFAALWFSAPAFAADMAVKAPPSVVAAPYSWTGFYLGGTLGYSVAHDAATDQFTFSVTSDTATIAPRGVVGGGEAGYNWQAGQWLLGLEGDWQWSGEKDSFCLDCFPLPGRAIAQDLPWFATVRGRLGYTVGPALFYATGGVAFGDVKTTLTCCFNGTSAAFDDRKTGWVAGAGIEAAVTGNWTAKIEYLYLDFGSIVDTFAVPGGTMTGTSGVHDHIFRVGLNYRIGGTPYQVAYSPSRMPMKAPILNPLYNWTGVYVGANAGYGIGRDATTQSFAGVPSDLFAITPVGWLGGVQLGYNFQAANNWVLGVEGDWQWTGQKDVGLIRDFPITPGFTNQNIQQKLPWFATIRGRVGYAAGPVLYYATAGVAFTDLQSSYSESQPASYSAAFDNHRTGFAAGGGIEAALGGNWTAKAEYLYLDFGNVTILEAPVSLASISGDMHDHVFRLGVNYGWGGH